MFVWNMKLSGQSKFFLFLVISWARSRLPGFSFVFRLNRLKIFRQFRSIDTGLFICHEPLHRHHKRRLFYFKRATSCLRFHSCTFVLNTFSFDWVCIQCCIIMMVRPNYLHRILFMPERILLSRAHLLNLTIIIIGSFFLLGLFFNYFYTHFFYCLPELIHIKTITRRLIMNYRLISCC